MPTPFVLGQEAEDNVKRSFRSLASHIGEKKGEEGQIQAVYLVINTKSSMVKTKDYTPRIIPLTRKLDDIENKLVLLITKDPSLPYRKALEEKNSPTEDTFNQIYTVNKVKTIAKDPRKLRNLAKESDLIVADHRVHKLLPGILGPQFYVKNKKVPFMVQMARPDPQAKLVKAKKSHKLKDERCEPAYVKKQLKAIAANTSFIPPANGTCISVKIGYCHWKNHDIQANINDVVDYLVNPKHLPVGGLVKTVKNVESVHLKTSDSISLPIFKQKNPKNDDNDHNDDDSDLDF